jgi:hypothetical protein
VDELDLAFAAMVAGLAFASTIAVYTVIAPYVRRY